MPVVAFRFANWDTPLWINPSRSEARFNRLGDPPTQYFGLHPLTPLAEFLRGQGLREPQDLRDIRLRTWAAVVETEAVEISFDTASDFGISAQGLVDDDWSACQDLADRLRGDGTTAIVVPSAALPGTANLVLFGERVAVSYLEIPRDPLDVPVSVTADAARPPVELVGLVRYKGQAHAGYDSWSRGNGYVFVEPRYAT